MKSKPICSLIEWQFAITNGLIPEVIVDVRNFEAHIMVFEPKKGEYVNVTEKLKNGRKLAKESVIAYGGSLGRSGWYPPTEKLYDRLIKKGLIE